MDAALVVRPGTARAALLLAHAKNQEGLTDEEAAAAAKLELTSEYATRCSELLRSGFLVDTKLTRSGRSGLSRIVRRITRAGLDLVESWSFETKTTDKKMSTPSGPSSRCPTCGNTIDEVQYLLGGFVRGRCGTHGKVSFRAL